MDTAHRRELKHDKFVDQVGQSVEYAAEHRDQMIKWGGAALVVLLLAAGVYTAVLVVSLGVLLRRYRWVGR